MPSSEVAPETTPELAREAFAAPTLRTYLGISLFWFAISFFWGAMLIIVMPARIEEIVGPANKDGAWALVSSVGALLSGLTQIVFGALSDNSTHRLGRRQPYLIFGVLATTVVLLFFPGAQTLGALLGVYIGIQLFLNIANGPYQALMPDMIPPAYHGRASAFMGICLLLGRIGGAAIAGFLMQSPQGVQQLTWIFIAILNGLMIANIVCLRETPHTNKVSLGAALKSVWDVPLRPYPSFVWLMVSRFGINLGLTTVTFCLLYYIGDTLGQGEKAAKGIAANFLVLTTIAALIGTLPAGYASDRFSKKKVLFVSNGIAMVAGSVFALAPNVAVAQIAAIIFGVGFGTFAAVDWALACNLLPPGAPAKYLGVWGFSDNLAQVVAPVIAGPLAYSLNQNVPGAGYRLLMGVAIIYFALGTIAIVFIKENPVQPPLETTPETANVPV